MSRRAGNVSIKQLSATTNNEGETIITGPSVGGASAADVEQVITSMINNNDLIDENDVKDVVDNKLSNYTTTADLQENYATKTLLSNTLDNYASKELLTQSLSDKATYSVTDAITTTTTNHETRIKGLEDNFVSKTSLVEILTPQQQQVNTALSNCAKLNANNDFTGDVQTFESHYLLQSPPLTFDPNKSFSESAIFAIAYGNSGGMLNYKVDYNSQTQEVLERFIVGLVGGTKITFSENSITSESTIVGSNVLANNETRLAACEAAIASSGNVDLSNYATISAMNTALEGKSATGHTHTLDDISNFTKINPYTDVEENDVISSVFDTNDKSNITFTINFQSKTNKIIALKPNPSSTFEYSWSFGYYNGMMTFNNTIVYSSSGLSYNAESDFYVMSYQINNNSVVFTFSLNPSSNANISSIEYPSSINLEQSYEIFAYKDTSYGRISYQIDNYDLIAPNLLSNNETRLAACEAAIASSGNVDLSNCAKLNTSNTFTGDNFFNGDLLCTNSDLGNETSKSILIGKYIDNGYNAKISYIYNDTEADRRLNLSLANNSGLNIYNNKVESLQTFLAPAITLNGNDLATTLSNCAKLNTRNEFTGNNTFSGDSYFSGATTFANNVEIVNSTLNNGGSCYFHFGFVASNNNCAEFEYYKDASPLSRCLKISMKGNNGMRIYPETIIIDLPLYVPSLYINNTSFNTYMNNKANTNHNHDSTYAKLSGDNTFTGTNTFSSDLNIINSNATIDNSQYATLMLGQDKTTSRSNFLFRFQQKSHASDGNKLELGFYDEYPMITIYPNSLDFNRKLSSGIYLSNNNLTTTGTISAKTITLNGNDLETTLSGKASISGNNTFTGTNTFNNEVNINSSIVKHLKSDISSGSDVEFYIGKSTSESLLLTYNYKDSLSSSFGGIGVGGNSNIIQISNEAIAITAPMYSTSSISATGFTNTSDIRMKENIKELNNKFIIDDIKVYSFNFKNDKSNRLHYGVIAQELQEIAPELVSSDRNNEHYLSVNYIELIPHLINKIHSLNNIISQLQAGKALMEQQISELSEKLNKISELLGI